METVPHYHSILLVEDDKRLSDLITEYLEKQGLKVMTEYRGDTAVQRIIQEQPDLVILDLMLPGLDGLEVCRQVRSSYPSPILMLTARDEDVDQVVGLEIGADDYVVKPVQPRVLLARVRALLRRNQTAQMATAQALAAQPEKGALGQQPMHGNPDQPTSGISSNYSAPHASSGIPEAKLCFGQLEVDPASREVHLNKQLIDLTTQEFDLLHLMAKNAGVVLSRDAIFEAMSGIEYDGLDRSVDIRISRLRKLLETNPGKPSGIKTVRGQGYLFSAQGWPYD